jgi:threonine/homoserine/homoserine lactone efflux protein
MILPVYFKYILLIGYGLVLGFLSAIPIGAVQLEVVKKAINGHLVPAVSVALGSATSDLVYGVLTLFGLGAFLFHKDSQIVLYVLGIAVLLFLLYRAFKEYRHTAKHDDPPRIYRNHHSFMTGFTIAITNPGIIIWWIVGFKLFDDMGLFTEMSPTIKIFFILSCCAGLGGYLSFLAIFLHRVHHNLPDTVVDRLQLVLMFLFAMVIVYFAYKLVMIITGQAQAAMPGGM